MVGRFANVRAHLVLFFFNVVYIDESFRKCEIVFYFKYFVNLYSMELQYFRHGIYLDVNRL